MLYALANQISLLLAVIYPLQSVRVLALEIRALGTFRQGFYRLSGMEFQ